MTLSCIFGDTETAFKQVNPVLWRKTNKSVIEGNKRVITTVNYQSPCLIFENMENTNHSIVQWCDEAFEENFLQPIKAMCSNPTKSSDNQVSLIRKKRLVILSAIVIGTVIISVFATIGISSWSLVKSFNNDAKIENLEEQQRKMMDEIQLNRMNDASIKKILIGLEDKLDIIDEQVRILTNSIRKLEQDIPKTMKIIAN